VSQKRRIVHPPHVNNPKRTAVIWKTNHPPPPPKKIEKTASRLKQCVLRRTGALSGLCQSRKLNCHRRKVCHIKCVLLGFVHIFTKPYFNPDRWGGEVNLGGVKVWLDDVILYP